jgi:hypothetical protein
MKAHSELKKVHTVKSILDRYFDSYLHSNSRVLPIDDHHLKAVNTIRLCQTKALGVHYFSCEDCGDTHILPRSCKHRFCSRCGAADTHRWVEKMLSSLLDIKHHHVVFTLPKGLRHISKMNGDKIHDLLFRSSSYVLKDWFARKHELRCGIVSVLHTNGSDLKYHPHVHMIVTGGGLTIKDEVSVLERDYLCNQEYLGRQFKRVFISRLMKMYDEGSLQVSSRIKNRIDLLKRLKDMSVGRKNWVVKIEKPMRGVEKLIAYVGRYTKRSCISERRILSVSDEAIVLSYKDYKNSERGKKPIEKLLKLSPHEFLDRLLQHIPSWGYKVVRYYGIYAPSELMKLPTAQRGQRPNEELPDLDCEDHIDNILVYFKTYRQLVKRRTGKDPLYCYACEKEMRLRQVVYEKGGVIKVVEIERSD